MTISYTNLNALPDVLMTDRYGLFLTPAGAGAANTQALYIRCLSLQLPGSEISSVPVGLNGVTLHWRGKRDYEYTMQIAFVETSDGIVHNTLLQWMEYIAGTDSQNGATKANYATTATIEIYDEQGNTAHSMEIDNVWPMQVPSINIQGDQAGPYVVVCTFVYDRRIMSGVTVS